MIEKTEEMRELKANIKIIEIEYIMGVIKKKKWEDKNVRLIDNSEDNNKEKEKYLISQNKKRSIETMEKGHNIRKKDKTEMIEVSKILEITKTTKIIKTTRITEIIKITETTTTEVEDELHWLLSAKLFNQ